MLWLKPSSIRDPHSICSSSNANFLSLQGLGWVLLLGRAFGKAGLVTHRVCAPNQGNPELGHTGDRLSETSSLGLSPTSQLWGQAAGLFLARALATAPYPTHDLPLGELLWVSPNPPQRRRPRHQQLSSRTEETGSPAASQHGHPPAQQARCKAKMLPKPRRDKAPS